jgi:RNA polymerase sigma-70 factor (ECF subfamily)
MQDDNIKRQLEHHHKDCYGWALHCCNQDKEMAYDVVQASYLKMLEHQDTFREQSTFKTWAFRIIKNSAIDTFRNRKREAMIMQVETALADTGYDGKLGDDFDQKLREQFFSRALSQLSDRQRQILQLVFYHDMSLNQSAEVLNISQGSVRKHYDRAKKILADWFQKNGIINYND